MPRGELHIQLIVGYARDAKLAGVSRSARLLYVDALCLAKEVLNDGVISVAQVEQLMYPERPAAARRVAQELVSSGAWAWDEQSRTYTILAWLKRNKSREQVHADQAAAKERSELANHTQYHEGRGEVRPGCHFCSQQGSTDGSHRGIPKRIPSDVRPGSPETETETETENKHTSSPASPATDDDPHFTAFWAAYPRRVGKGDARKAWSKAIKGGADPAGVIAAAEAYAGQCARDRTQPRYIKHPASWLNGERWTDQPTSTATTRAGIVPFWDA